MGTLELQRGKQPGLDGITNGRVNDMVPEVISTPSNGNWYFWPAHAENLGAILASTGDGKLQVYMGASADLLDGGTENADLIVDWSAGAIGATTVTTVFLAGQAIRQVNISGDTTLSIVAAVNH